jgi:hypothetical protein
MMKLLVTIAISLSAMTGFANEARTCTCQRDFKDSMDNTYEMTMYAYCPDYNQKSDLVCDSEITKTQFSASCTNNVTGEQNVSTSSLVPGSYPAYGYTYCSLK